MQAEAVVLVKSDLHTGKQTAEYNLDVTQQVLERAYTTVEKLVALERKSRKIDEFFDLNIGDMVDGQLIYKTHPFHVDKRADFARAQANVLYEMTVPHLDRIVARSKFVTIKEVIAPGNHGRSSWFAHESDNYDLIVADLLRVHYRDSKTVEVVEVRDRPGRITIKGHDFLLYHGQTIRMYMKVPWYGIMQRVKDWAFHEPYFYGAIMGHFHTFGEQREAGRVVMLNGTAVVDDDFSREVLGRRGEPYWHLFGVHPERGITWRYDLHLYDPAKTMRLAAD